MKVQKMILFIIIFIAILFLSKVLIQPIEAYNGDYIEIYVSNGDRLWDIAEEYYDNYEAKDIRQIIYEIKQDNGLEKSDLHIGQKLLIRKGE